MSDLATLYRFHRQRNATMTGRGAPVRAATALELARADLAAGVNRYPSQGYSARMPRPADSPVYFESDRDAAAAGFRFVDYADQIVGRGIDHTGWFTDPDGGDGETYRGAVFQLATGAGCLRFVAGYEESCSGGFVVDVRGRGVVHSEPFDDPMDCDRLRDLDACRDAAFAADSFAENAAEREREYQESWQAGAKWRDMGEEIADLRATIRIVLAERHEVKGVNAPALCAVIRAKVGDMLEQLGELRSERLAIVSDFYGDRGAFNEGAGEVVV